MVHLLALPRELLLLILEFVLESIESESLESEPLESEPVDDENVTGTESAIFHFYCETMQRLAEDAALQKRAARVAKQAAAKHAALIDLALTCRAFGTEVRRRLHRTVSTVHPPMQRGTPIFAIHAICKEPYVGAHVEELTLGGPAWPSLYVEKSSDKAVVRRTVKSMIEVFNAGFREHGIVDVRTSYYSPSAHVVTWPWQKWAERNIRVENGEPYQMKAIEDVEQDESEVVERYRRAAVRHFSAEEMGALAALAILKSPGLRRLVLLTGPWTLPRSVMRPGQLENLRKLKWTHHEFHSSALLAGDIKLDHGIKWLFEAAGSLRKLTLTKVNYIAPDFGPRLDSVQELVLKSCRLSEDSVGQMCRVFPRLQRLSFAMDSCYANRERPATCAFVVSLLVDTYAESLEYLDWQWRLDFDKHVEPERRDAARSLAGLRSMTVLKKLVITMPNFHHGDGPGRPEDEEAFWAAILAPHLEVLRIKYIYWAWNALPLLAAIDKGCKKMRRVKVRWADDPPGDEAALKDIVKQGTLRYEFEYKVYL